MAAYVVSYNLLSQKLCQPEWYVHCASASIDPHKRRERLEKKLIPLLEENAVICLQELSASFAAHLVVLFERHGYHLVHDQYAGKSSGFMGVGIAYPRARYELQDAVIESPTDERWVRESQAAANKRNDRLPSIATDGRATAIVAAALGVCMAVKGQVMGGASAMMLDVVAAAVLLFCAQQSWMCRANNQAREPQKTADQQYFEDVAQAN